MKINFDDERPIFVQIADEIEDGIFLGAFPEETQIPSTTEVSTQFKINPATVLKGMNRLIDDEIIYKKRGVGMFVKTGAVKQIRQKRLSEFYEVYVEKMLREARKLGLSKSEIVQYVENGMEEKDE